MKLNVVDPRPTRDVPCGTCTRCCQNDAVFLHPECGDDVMAYHVELYKGRLMLAHKSNGDCIYLDRKHGCTIHSRRPVACREMDCRALLDAMGEARLRGLGLGGIVDAAKRLKERAGAA